MALRRWGVIAARQLWEDIEPDLRQFVQDRATELTEALRNRMKETGKSAIEEEKDRFRLRLKEVERAMSENTSSNSSASGMN